MNNLEKAAAYLEEFGHNKDGNYFKGVGMLINVDAAIEQRGAPACALGAIYATASDDDEAEESCQKLSTALGVAYRYDIPLWSDVSTKKAVVGALRKAANL